MALRNLLKYRTHSIISVICLAIGITFFTLVWHFTNMVDNMADLPRNEERIHLIAINESNANYINWQDICFLQSQQIIGIDSLAATSYSDKIEITLFDHQQNEYPYLAERQYVSPNFFAYHGLTLLQNNRIFTAPDEIVINENFARRILGNQSPIGMSIRVDTKFSKENSIENFKIVNVVKNEISPTSILADIFFHPEIAPEKPYKAISFLNGKASLNHINNQLKEVEWTGNNKITYCYAQITSKNHIAQALSVLLIRFLASLLLLSGIINFLKFIIQMFYNRQRELSIRQCLGSNWKGMFGLLFAEVFWTISIALFLSLCLSEISTAVLNYVVPESEMPRIHFDEVFPLQIQIFTGVLVFCSVVILFPIYKLRRISIIRPITMSGGKHLFRNSMIGVQLAISLFFVGGVWVISLFFDSFIGESFNPLSSKEEKQILSIPINTERLRTNWDLILQKIQALPEYEDYTYLSSENGFQSMNYNNITYHKNEKEQKIVIVQEGDIKSFDFFHIPITGDKDISEASPKVYVDEQFMHQLQTDGNTGTVRLGNNDYQIAGTYKALFKQSNITQQEGGVGSVFFINSWKGICYLKFALGKDMKDIRTKVENFCREYVPTTLPLKITPLDKASNEKTDTILIMMRCGILLGFVSIILVILSVYSAISIDTVSRQKEIAIRKINGASAKEICLLFAKPYITIYLLSFAFIYPLLRLILIELTNGYMGIAYQWSWGIGLFIGFALLLIIITAQKIWEVMHVNPATIIKKE